MTIGDKIAKARKNANYTQDQLAELLEVTRQTVSKWESDLAYPETSKLTKLAGLLGVSCDYLLQEGNGEKQITMVPDESGYTIDWTNLYPILNQYQSAVDCEHYYKTFENMVREIMEEYGYSLDDAMLVLKDLLYQTYLKIKKKGTAVKE